MYKFLAVVAAAFFATALPTITHAQSLPDAPVPYVQTVSALTPSTSVFSQTDPRWAKRRIGAGTVKDEGCYVISLAQGMEKDPNEVIDKLQAHRVIDGRGRIRTPLIEKALPLKLLARFPVSRADPLTRITEELGRNMMVLLELDHSARGGRGKHFVLVKKAANGDLIVADPARGREASLLDLYGRLGVKTVLVFMRLE